MESILIMGENSFIGKNIIKHSKHTVIDEVSLIDKRPEDIDFSKYDVVIHLVAIVHQSSAIVEDEYFRVNRDLCVQTATEAKKAGVKQFIFLSTVKVYGIFEAQSGPWNERSDCNPIDAYGKSKYEAEIALRELEDKDYCISIVRTPLVYGEGVRANMLSITKLIDNIRILPFGKINNSRNFTYIKNLIGFIDRIIEKRVNGIFIAMDSKSLSTTELVRLIAHYMKKKIILVSIPGFLIVAGKKAIPKIFERLFDSFEMDNSETLNQLDFSPPYTPEEGIKDMVETYLTQKQTKNK